VDKRRLRNRVLLAIASGLLVVGFLFFRHHHERYRIPQNGMYPDMPAGTGFWVTKHPYRTIGDVRRGDIIVFRRDRGGVAYDYVWRVIALPGERIGIHQDAVIINGQSLPRTPLRDEDGNRIFEETAGGRTYRIAVPPQLTSASDFPEVTVPAGHVFVLGDNRHHASDSRSIGAVAFDSILARAGIGR
jgi:signal peptidase I